MYNSKSNFSICSVFRYALLVTVIAGMFAAWSCAGMPACRDVTLTWNNDPHTTQTITWKSDRSVSVSTVTYGVAGTTEPVRKIGVPAENTSGAFCGDAFDGALFSVTLQGLVPGTTYAYTLSSPDAVEGPYTFITEKRTETDFKFLIFGDSQSGNKDVYNYLPWQETIHSAYDRNPDAKFFVNVGDLVETGQSDAHWKAWFKAARGVIERIPAMPVTGNHETYCPGLLQSAGRPEYFLKQFNLPLNGPVGLQGQVYSYDYGCAHVVVLDSQQEEESPSCGDILAAQRNWLAKDMQATLQPWKIVFFHKPPYNNKLGRANPAVKEAFCDVFDQYHVDVVFNGHEHGLYRTYPIKGGKIQKEPQDGTIYYTTGRSGAKFYKDIGPNEFDTFSYNPKEQPCYETVEVTSVRMIITACNQDGSVIDSFTIGK